MICHSWFDYEGRRERAGGWLYIVISSSVNDSATEVLLC